MLYRISTTATGGFAVLIDHPAAVISAAALFISSFASEFLVDGEALLLNEGDFAVGADIQGHEALPSRGRPFVDCSLCIRVGEGVARRVEPRCSQTALRRESLGDAFIKVVAVVVLACGHVAAAIPILQAERQVPALRATPVVTRVFQYAEST